MITDDHVRLIIREEIKRSQRGDLCTEEYLSEKSSKGVMGLFGDLFKPFQKFYGNLWKKISKKVEGYYDGFVRELEAEIKKATNGEKIDFKNKEHKKLYIEGMVEPTVKSLKEALNKLQTAKNVVDWTPKSSSDEDLKAWKNSEDGKNANALFDAHGFFMGIADSFAPIANSVAQAEKSGQGLSSPTETAQWMNDFLDSVKDIESEATAVEADADFSEMFSLVDQCSALVGEIASNMKDSTNEAREKYKKLILAVDFVINEQKNKNLTKKTLTEERKLIERRKNSELDKILSDILRN